jgi:hypothetical protein
MYEELSWSISTDGGIAGSKSAAMNVSNSSMVVNPETSSRDF